MNREEYNKLTYEIIGAAMEVHSTLGVGLLEVAYRKALAHELRLRGMDVKEEVPIEVTYKNNFLGIGFRADIIVNHEIIIEIKATEEHPIHQVQLHTYLKCLNLKLGLLINFHCDSMRDGITRIVNNF